MLTDAILQEATAEAERFLLSIVPEAEEAHRFSMRFERKMKKLIRKANHPIRYQVIRAAAVVLLVLATLFGTLVAVNPEVRAAVVGWVKETFPGYFVYSSNNTSAPETYDYCLTVLPEGYQEWKVIDSIGGKTYYYINREGNKFYFRYANNISNGSGNLFIKSEDCKQLAGLVNGLQADLYIGLKDGDLNTIAWQDPDTNVLLYISIFADPDELIELAESVIKINN